MTTHSMEEAETLSSRIGIMAQGRLKCIGSSVHLKNKFGSGYTITVNRIPQSATASQAEAEEEHSQGIASEGDLDSFMFNEVGRGSGSLLSAVNHTRKYKVPKSGLPIAEIFMLMENNRKRLGVREWGLSMTTLEEVFITTVQNADRPKV